MKIHKSEVAITTFICTPTRKQCRHSPEMNTGRNSKQPASAGTLGEKGLCHDDDELMLNVLRCHETY